MKDYDLSDQFVPPEKFEKSLKRQKHAAGKFMEMLKRFRLRSEKPREVEFFFYAPDLKQTHLLQEALKKLQYHVSDQSGSSPAESFSIIGHTPTMAISEKSLSQWTAQMCELGFIYDCKFDGYGMLHHADDD